MSTHPSGQVTWIVPPECQGQIIECAYGVDDDGRCWERARDGSDGSTSYRYLGLADEDDGEWMPWQRVPTIAREDA